mmetsp:Transcript_9678/g.33396  ORF Transcript_9678/g.33396 Transcript_9678/m.33396 type:complete len:609 (+) Transcript_9678:2632-4458(+)
MEHLELLSGVPSGVDENGLLAAWVVVQKVGDVVDLAPEDDPTVLRGVVLGDLLSGEDDTCAAGGGSGHGVALGRVLRLLEASTLLQGVEGEVQQVPGGRGTRHPSKDDTVQQRVSTQPVPAVDSPRNLAGGVEALDGLTPSPADPGVRVDLEAAHAVVDDGGDLRDMERVAHRVRDVGEELLAKAVRVPLAGVRVVLVEGVAELGGGDSHLVAQLLAGQGLHHPPALVVLAVPLDLLAGLAVEHEPEGAVALVHAVRDVVPRSELVAEPVSLGVDQNTAHSPERLGGQELDLGVGLRGVDEAGGVDLDPVDVDVGGAHGLGHLDSVSGAVLAVGGGQVLDVRPDLDEDGVVVKISPKASGGDDHRPVELLPLSALQLVLQPDDLAARVPDEVLGGGLGDDPGLLSLGLLLNLLQRLHERVGDGEPGELLLATVGPREGMAAHERQLGEVQLEALHEPVHSGAGAVRQDVCKWLGVLWWGRVLQSARGLQDILLKGHGAVVDVLVHLGLGQRSADPAGRLRGVSSQEGHLVHQSDAAAVLDDGVGGGEPGEAASYDNHAGAHGSCVGLLKVRRLRSASAPTRLPPLQLYKVPVHDEVHEDEGVGVENPC